MHVVKKDGTLESFNPEKIIKACRKAAIRTLKDLTKSEEEEIINRVKEYCDGMDTVSIEKLHNIVESSLSDVNKKVAESYKSYRNYKIDFVRMLDDVYQESQRIMYIGDKENSNSDSALVSTKRSLIFNQLNKELYKKFFLTTEELQAAKDGYIYIHDMSARRDTVNCCLFNIQNVLSGGFEMGNVWYNEPKTLDVAFDVVGDVTLASASQQYGGFTLPEIDKVLKPYAEKSLKKHIEKYISLGIDEKKSNEIAWEDLKEEIRQGFQGWEYKFNTVASSRGDYPFITITLGLGESEIEQLICKIALQVRMKGQGKEGFKKPVLFPKIVFLYDEDLHSEGKPLHDVYKQAIECSSTCMYPDFLSLTGDGYISNIYKKYKRVISPMGCVDGQEVITYKINDELFVESFERAYNRIIDLVGSDKGQNFNDDLNRYIDVNSLNISIFDSKLNGFTKVKYFIRNKQNNWCDVTFTQGRKLRVTTDHPFETENRGVVFAKDLQKEDLIKVNHSQYSESKDDYDIDKAWLEGFLLADGCYQNYGISASVALKGEDDIAEHCKLLMETHLKLPTRINEVHSKSGGDYKEIRSYSDGNDGLNKNINYLTERLGGVQKKYRHIPNEIFNCREDVRYSFLAGLIDADGYIDNQTTGISKVQIGSVNKELAIQELLLAQSLGMKGQIYACHYCRDKEKIQHKVEFYIDEKLISYMKSEKKISKFIDKECKYRQKKNFSHPTKIVFLDLDQYSYDVTTESEHFDVSGVYSHNCRAFLSPYYERGGINPADDDDKPVYVGRFNIGAISLHLPMILAKSREENKDFYEVLDYYMEMIRKIHIRTYEYLGEMKASTNPLAYCFGGFLGGNLDFKDKIKPLLKSATASFGITALNELQELYNGKSLVEDGSFALEVMEYINKKVQEFKTIDGNLYAIYGTPAESLCELQVKQFRKKYGVIKNVSDRPYVSNSFHCHVTEDITPIMKQDKENRFWNLFNGGKIQYVRYPINYNKEAIETLVHRAMDLGLYEGINLSLAYCEDCGHEELNMDVCPKCGSKNLTKIDRMNGYLSYSRVHGDTRLNAGKMAEIHDRISM